MEAPSGAATSRLFFNCPGPFSPFPCLEFGFNKKDGKSAVVLAEEDFVSVGKSAESLPEGDLESTGTGEVVSDVRDVFRPGDLLRGCVLDSDILLSDANLLLLLPACPDAAAFRGCENNDTDLAVLARAPDEKFATADGAKNFTLPVSGPDLNVFSRVSDGFVDGVETGTVEGGDVEGDAQDELSVGSFLDTGDIRESLIDLLTGVCTLGALEGDFLTGVMRGFLLLSRPVSRDRALLCMVTGLGRLLMEVERPSDLEGTMTRSRSLGPPCLCFIWHVSQYHSPSGKASIWNRMQ